jgi:hypothetical protein
MLKQSKHERRVVGYFIIKVLTDDVLPNSACHLEKVDKAQILSSRTEPTLTSFKIEGGGIKVLHQERRVVANATSEHVGREMSLVDIKHLLSLFHLAQLAMIELKRKATKEQTCAADKTVRQLFL